MGIADDLLDLAFRLAYPASVDPVQASLRRSVSTAYYALFHLFVTEAAQRWNGTPAIRFGLQRSFEHKRMKATCDAMSRGRWKGWSIPPLTPSPELRFVAQSFVQLQEARHKADYANEKEWEEAEVRDQVATVQEVFRQWRSIHADPAVDEFLLSLLIGDRRE